MFQQEIQQSLDELETSFIDHDVIEHINSTTGATKLGAKCFIEANGKVNCSDIIYDDEKSWKKSRFQIDLLIKVLKNKINDLKEIKKHLRENKPSHLKDYEEVVSVEDDVEHEKHNRRNHLKPNGKLNRSNSVLNHTQINDNTNKDSLDRLITDRNEIPLVVDKTSSYEDLSFGSSTVDGLLFASNIDSLSSTTIATTTTTTSTTTAIPRIPQPHKLNHKPKINRTHANIHRNNHNNGRKIHLNEMPITSFAADTVDEVVTMSIRKQPKDKQTTRIPKQQQHSTISSIKSNSIINSSVDSTSGIGSTTLATDIDDFTLNELEASNNDYTTIPYNGLKKNNLQAEDGSKSLMDNFDVTTKFSKEFLGKILEFVVIFECRMIMVIFFCRKH